MNVLLISPLPPPAGGIASWTKKYLESREAKEYNIFVVNTAVIGNRVKEYNKRKLGYELKRMKHIRSDLKKQLNQINIDVVHLNCAVGRFGSIIKDYIFADIVRKSKAKLVVHFHCNLSDMVDGKTDLFFFKKIVKMADIVLTLNESSKNFTYGKCDKKSIIIPNFLPDEFFDSMPDDKAISDSIKSVLFVGRVEEEKGCDVIYEAAKRFPDIQFNLLGYISDEFKKLERPSNVNLPGEVSNEQVKAEMLKSDLLLFPSRTEGFPYVVIEAMACGLPVISTPVGAIPDILEDNGGILVPVNDVNAVAESISILQNKELRRKTAAWNRQKVKNHYTADKVMNQFFDIYQMNS